jgi:hypothetical protein
LINAVGIYGLIAKVWIDCLCGSPVVSDAGRNIVVPYYYFKLIDEYRKEQIEKILA